MSEEKKEKTSKELKQELIELRAKEIKGLYSELADWCSERSISLGLRTITEEPGGSRTEIFIIDNL